MSSMVLLLLLSINHISPNTAYKLALNKAIVSNTISTHPPLLTTAFIERRTLFIIHELVRFSTTTNVK